MTAKSDNQFTYSIQYEHTAYVVYLYNVLLIHKYIYFQYFRDVVLSRCI